MNGQDDVAIVRRAISKVGDRTATFDIIRFAKTIGYEVDAMPVDLVVAQSRETIPDNLAVASSAQLIATSADPRFWLSELLTVAEPTPASIAVASEVCRRIFPDHPLARLREPIIAVTAVYDGFVDRDDILSRDLRARAMGAGGYILLDHEAPLDSWLVADFSVNGAPAPGSAAKVAAGRLKALLTAAPFAQTDPAIPKYIGAAVAIFLGTAAVAAHFSREGE